MNRAHVPVFDGLRGVAVLAVVAAHYWPFEDDGVLLGWVTAICDSG